MCACRVVNSFKARGAYEIKYCPTHEAASEMLAVLKDIKKVGPLVKLNVKNGDHFSWMVNDAAVGKAIYKAEGGK